MQATTHRFDQESGEGSVITDAGLVVPIAPGALEASGLRLLRLGQRVGIELAADGRSVEALWMPGVAHEPAVDSLP